MSTALKTDCDAPAGALARVLGRSGDELLVTPLSGPAAPRPVRCALPPGVAPAQGDEVVVLETADGPVAIAALGPAALTLPDGTSARAEGAVLEVLRADGTPLFRYEAGAGAGRITLANESIDVHAAAGDLRLRAAGEVRLEGRSVEAVSRAAGARSSLRLGPREATLDAARMRLAGEELEVEATTRTAFASAEARAVLGRAVVEAARLETVADVVVQTARNLYQRVQELAQKRAGDLRTIVDDTIQVKARQVLTRAVDAYKIRSEKIHLG